MYRRLRALLTVVGQAMERRTGSPDWRETARTLKAHPSAPRLKQTLVGVELLPDLGDTDKGTTNAGRLFRSLCGEYDEGRVPTSMLYAPMYGGWSVRVYDDTYHKTGKTFAQAAAAAFLGEFA